MPKVAAIRAARDEAIERVGRWLYGPDWIGELGKQEWIRGKKDGDLPAGPEDARRLAQARFKSRAQNDQYATVFRWLQGTFKIDCAPSSFDAAQFEKFWAATFPAAANAKDARHAAVRSRWAAGRRPGVGGTCSWKQFSTEINKACGARYAEKTIRRDVQELFGVSRL